MISQPHDFMVRRLAPADVGLFRAAMAMFGEAFEDPETYSGAPPSDAYLRARLGDADFVAVAALRGDAVVGALAAYVLRKFEQERGEVYIYDLAVARDQRRRGVATALIAALRPIARALGAHVIYVQADLADGPAIALYTKLGVREDVLHFDIAVD